MSTLRETKERINSVRNTLKITSAMRMVAAAKLRKAESAISNMRPYEQKLSEMLDLLISSGAAIPAASGALSSVSGGTEVHICPGRVAVLVFSSHSSLCGSFNSNVIRLLSKRIEDLKAEGVEFDIIPFGLKVSDFLKKNGYFSGEDFSSAVAHLSYQSAADISGILYDRFVEGRYCRVEMIYNHFISVASQKVVAETYLPLSVTTGAKVSNVPSDVIIEPSPSVVLESLLPKVIALKLYTVLLDSTAAEHAARSVAMQSASDNARSLIDDLTLEYNKGRQQKITSELLDIVGGSMQ